MQSVLTWARGHLAPKEFKGRLSRAQIYAREVTALAEYPETVSVPIQAFRIGDLAVAQSPCETFAETGLGIKTASPFRGNTFTIELANGYSGYLPTAEQFELGGYETWPARSSFLEIEAESKIRSGLNQSVEARCIREPDCAAQFLRMCGSRSS